MIYLIDHPGKARPIPQPIAVAMAPTIKTSIPDFTLLCSVNSAFIRPNMKSSAPPMQMQAIHGCLLYFIMPELTIQGRTGNTPNIKKEKNVTIPHFMATTGSIVTNCSSSSIIMLTNACLLVEQSQAILTESSILKPFSVQMSRISFFYLSNKWSTS